MNHTYKTFVPADTITGCLECEETATEYYAVMLGESIRSAPLCLRCAKGKAKAFDIGMLYIVISGEDAAATEEGSICAVFTSYTAALRYIEEQVQEELAEEGRGFDGDQEFEIELDEEQVEEITELVNERFCIISQGVDA